MRALFILHYAFLSMVSVCVCQREILILYLIGGGMGISVIWNGNGLWMESYEFLGPGAGVGAVLSGVDLLRINSQDIYAKS